ncbi:hypothetical protein [Gynurincola endophyticus]|uniref:hypothetical protein n=1 Tax=Gynurincola endophyticus TaxID=2479004 RepID=UPI000F8E31E0|nr:hypothetical protein [Gynurincola endophyticus]
MTTNVNVEEIIEFFYKDATPAALESTASQIEEDFELQEELESIQNIADQLDAEIVSPRPELISAILDYARKTAPSV